MMNRITQKFLEKKVEYLSRRLNTDFRLDVYFPGGNPYAYRLQYVRNPVFGATYHDMTNHRMTNREMLAYINGMLDCADWFKIGVR